MFNNLINASFLLTIGLIAGLVLIVVLSVTFRFWRRKKIQAAKYEEATLRRCVKCGYVVEKLDIPRCPECGSAIGFTKTFSELGVSDEELETALAKKKRDAN